MRGGFAPRPQKQDIMATYHCSVNVGSKGKAAAHADYIAREGKYSAEVSRERYEDLEATAYGNMPTWARHNPAAFWRAADEYERANGATYREIEVALPRELTPEQRRALVEDFVRQEIGDRHAYQWAIHCPRAKIDGGEQPHAHIMYSERTVDGIERIAERYFKRYNARAPERGGCRKDSAGTEERLAATRERWANIQNAHLEQHGHEARVDHRSLADQGITDRQPEIHLGSTGARRLTEGDKEALIVLRAEQQKIAASLRESWHLPPPEAGQGRARTEERAKREDTPAPAAPTDDARRALLDARLHMLAQRFRDRKERERQQEIERQVMERQREINRRVHETERLHRAAGNGREYEVLDALMNGADINGVSGYDQKTALMLAVIGQHSNTVRLLIEEGADVNARDKDGETPLHFVTDPATARVLIESGADVNARDKDGMTPLHRMAARIIIDENDRIEIGRLLIEAGADVNATNQRGKTAEQVAVMRGRDEFAQIVAPPPPPEPQRHYYRSRGGGGWSP